MAHLKFVLRRNVGAVNGFDNVVEKAQDLSMILGGYKNFIYVESEYGKGI